MAYCMRRCWALWDRRCSEVDGAEMDGVERGGAATDYAWKNTRRPLTSRSSKRVW